MSLDTAKAVSVLRSVTTKFDTGLRNATPFYPTLCYRAPSTGFDEEYGWLGSMPAVREWLGERVFNTLRAAKFTLPNKLWEDSLRIEKTDIADDRIGMYLQAAEQMGLEAAHHPDELLFTAIANGASTACFDGQYFFDTDHSWGDSGTQSNALTYNAADHLNVTVAEFKAAYNAARRAMIEFVNDRGKPLIRPVIARLSQLLLLVPTELEAVAHDALDSVQISGSTNIVLDKPQIVCSPYLTSAVKFQLYNLGSILKPFVFQDREPLTRQVKGTDDLEFKDVKFMTQARYNVGYLAWWNAVETTFN